MCTIATRHAEHVLARLGMFGKPTYQMQMAWSLLIADILGLGDAPG